MLYSKQTGGFYASEVHGNSIPSDAVEISDVAYEELLEGQSNGLRIVGATDGNPMLVDQDPPGAVKVVSMRQARLALHGAGLLTAVESAIDGLPSPQKEAARIEWEYSQEVHRDRPFVQTLGVAIGLNDEQLDALFTQAAAL